MAQHVLPGNPPVTVNLRHSPRARRISLRVSRLSGQVTLTLPRGVSAREGLAFAAEKADWMRGHLADRPAPVLAEFGEVLPVEGTPRRVVPGRGRSVRLGAEVLEVPGEAARVPARIAAFLKTAARDRLAAASDHYADLLGRPYARLTLRDTRSRWGSCSSEGNLMYSWRLIMAPPEVLAYVAAHEVAHLAHMDHSRAFWAQVAALYGDYAPHRAWLRAEGEALHRYRFVAELGGTGRND